ncbi:hypothetical protein ACGFJT_44245 [Actinomadura geliboluensis]|uniref:hypothetical protein n=1 Tax=Actinomadura geliboluensis TaxID=882440 RepID=UPI0037245749
MRIAGLPMNNVWAHRVLREPEAQTARAEGEPAEIRVFVESVTLAHHGPEQHYRPYLHITGELRAVRPTEVLPYGVKEVAFPPGGGETVDAFYEFDDEQLTRLTQKGYFNTGFVAPERVTGVEWALPAVVDTLVVEPTGRADGGGDIPVVFVNVHDLGNLCIDLESSEYDLVDYFDAYLKVGAGRVEQTGDDGSLRARSDTINPLFSEDGLDVVHGAGRPVAPAGEITVARNDLDALLHDVVTALADEEAQVRAERGQVAGTPENLYRQRVAGSFELEQAKKSDTAPPASADEHGLDRVAEHGGDPGAEPGTIKTTFEETRERLVEHVAELDHGEAGAGWQY